MSSVQEVTGLCCGFAVFGLASLLLLGVARLVFVRTSPTVIAPKRWRQVLLSTLLLATKFAVVGGGAYLSLVFAHSSAWSFVGGALLALSVFVAVQTSRISLRSRR